MFWLSFLDPDDYGLISQTLVFGPGNTRANITIPLKDDNVYESVEEFRATLTLVTPDDNVQLRPIEATIQITDDDG